MKNFETILEHYDYGPKELFRVSPNKDSYERITMECTLNSIKAQLSKKAQSLFFCHDEIKLGPVDPRQIKKMQKDGDDCYQVTLNNQFVFLVNHDALKVLMAIIRKNGAQISLGPLDRKILERQVYYRFRGNSLFQEFEAKLLPILNEQKSMMAYGPKYKATDLALRIRMINELPKYKDLCQNIQTAFDIMFEPILEGQFKEIKIEPLD